MGGESTASKVVAFRLPVRDVPTLASRAAAEGMKPATWVSALVAEALACGWRVPNGSRADDEET